MGVCSLHLTPLMNYTVYLEDFSLHTGSGTYVVYGSNPMQYDRNMHHVPKTLPYH